MEAGHWGQWTHWVPLVYAAVSLAVKNAIILYFRHAYGIEPVVPYHKRPPTDRAMEFSMLASGLPVVLFTFAPDTLHPYLLPLTAPAPVLALLRAAGAALMAVSLFAIVASWRSMGREWRIGVEQPDAAKAGPAPALVVTGAFKYCRHPIYVGMALGMCGLACYMPSLGMTLVLAHILYRIDAHMAFEELHLHKLFGAQYSQYCTRVKRWAFL